MTEYRMTDGHTIIIEMARTEEMARTAAAGRLGCEPAAISLLETKRRPLTEREARQQGYWERYAEYLLRVQRQKTKCPIGRGMREHSDGAERDTKQNTSI